MSDIMEDMCKKYPRRKKEFREEYTESQKWQISIIISMFVCTCAYIILTMKEISANWYILISLILITLVIRLYM